MSLSQVIRFQPGEIIANFTIVKITQDAPNYRERRYEVINNCCGSRGEHTQKNIRDAVRHNNQLCPACAAKARKLSRDFSHGEPIKIGSVIGAVTVLRAGDDNKHKLVKWGCCGREEQVPHTKLYKLRNAAKLATWEQRCMACYRAERSRDTHWLPRVRPQRTTMANLGLISAAIAWPRPQLGA